MKGEDDQFPVQPRWAAWSPWGTHGNLSSHIVSLHFGQYPSYTACWQRHWVWTTCPKLWHESGMNGNRTPVVKVVLWSRGEGFTWRSQVGANPIPIPTPLISRYYWGWNGYGVCTNLASSTNQHVVCFTGPMPFLSPNQQCHSKGEEFFWYTANIPPSQQCFTAVMGWKRKPLNMAM